MDIINHHSVGLLLLLTVSLLAMLFDVLPIMLIAVASALIWNFLFISPRYTFNVGTPEDVLLFSMYFVIVLMNSFFTTRIRNVEEKVREREKRENILELYNTFLNSLSHELRTPIAAIIGAIDTLKEQSGKLSEEARWSFFSKLKRESGAQGWLFRWTEGARMVFWKSGAPFSAHPLWKKT